MGERAVVALVAPPVREVATYVSWTIRRQETHVVCVWRGRLTVATHHHAAADDSPADRIEAVLPPLVGDREGFSWQLGWDLGAEAR